MKKFLLFLAMFGILFSVPINSAFAAENHGKILIAYFSRTGEENGVGHIQKGNTHIIAEIIAEKVGGNLYEIKPVKDYPINFNECKEVASKEKATKARPAIVGDIGNFDQYDTIFIGYPIWYGDMPMAVYTFLEKYNFDGKKIIPFCTHAGSGLSSTDQQITLACPNAKLLQGFEISGVTAQKNFSESDKKVSAWLKKIGFENFVQ